MVRVRIGEELEYRDEIEALNPKHYLPIREVNYIQGDPYYNAAFKGGIEHKHVVVDSNGDVWLMKSERGQSEIDANFIAASLGLRVPKVRQYIGPWTCLQCIDNVRRFGGTIVLIEWLHDTQTGDDYKPSTLQPEDVLRVAILDYIVGMWDRKGANWLWDSDGRVIPIDHGFTLEDHYQDMESSGPVDVDAAAALTMEQRHAIYLDARRAVVAATAMLHSKYEFRILAKLHDLADAIEDKINQQLGWRRREQEFSVEY